MKLLWAVSTVGTGHVFRNLDIAKELRNLLGPLEITHVSGGPAADILAQEGAKCLNLLPPVAVPVRDGWLDLIGLARSWLEQDRQSQAVASRLIAELRPEAVLADEVPGFALAARDRAIPAIYLTDFLFVDFTRPYYRNVRFNIILAAAGWKLVRDVRRAYEAMDLMVLMNNADLLPVDWRRWAADHCLVVGPLARELSAGRLDRQELREELGLHQDDKLIVVTIGGGDSGLYLARVARQAFDNIPMSVPEARMLIVLGPAVDLESVRLEPGDGVMVRGYEPNLVTYMAASDLVICSAGFSTLAEIALRAKVPAITSPIGSHWEQQANAEAAAAAGYAVKIDRNKLNANSLAGAAIRILSDPRRWREMAQAAESIEDAGAARLAAEGIAEVILRKRRFGADPTSSGDRMEPKRSDRGQSGIHFAARLA